jgi:hypothetical protein
MSDEFDLNGIVLIGAAFIVGYWVVGVIIARFKPKHRDNAPREASPRETQPHASSTHTLDSAGEREARANFDRDEESRRVLDAAQRLREQAAARAQEEQRRRQERDSRGY